ncbi:MAG: ABC transporter substrate-binding protein [Promethearchaeota archaeon]|jgi:peptide/nickel transport system substrate-binding protein
MNEEKAQPKKRVPKKKGIIVGRKPVIVGGLIVAFAAAGIVGGIFLFNIEIEEREQVFYWGTGGGLWALDPFDYVNRETFAILQNIAEPLFEYEFTAEGSSIVSNLALEGFWSEDGLNFTCTLRENVKFHDGTPFNATAVKWNFDRLNRLFLLGYIYTSLWVFPDGTPILKLNETTVIDDYTIRFVLNKPFVPLKSLLGLVPMIVSPKSTPADNFTRFETGNLIGTGPFKHESTVRGYDPVWEQFYPINSTLVANSEYWGGKPKIDKFIIKGFDNATLRKEAMLSGELNFNQIHPFTYEDYNNTPGINLIPSIHHENNFINMDNNKINTSMRKAISYALDYTELLKIGELWADGKVIRGKSPISYHMFYSNWTLDVPNYDIVKARQALKDKNWPGTENLTADDDTSPGNPWEVIAKSPNPLVNYNFTSTLDYLVHLKLSNLFQDNLTQIGVKINIPYVTWTEIRYAYFFGMDFISTQFLVTGWYPDYLDPNNCISPLYSNSSFENVDNVNDAQLQHWMEDAVEETNPDVRERLYDKIQKRLVEELYPCIWWYSPIQFAVFSSNVEGFNPYNTFKVPFKDWYFV